MELIPVIWCVTGYHVWVAAIRACARGDCMAPSLLECFATLAVCLVLGPAMYVVRNV